MAKDWGDFIALTARDSAGFSVREPTFQHEATRKEKGRPASLEVTVMRSVPVRVATTVSWVVVLALIPGVALPERLTAERSTAVWSSTAAQGVVVALWSVA
jgi:hypothetical protein